jgi:undecaprenyl-diphosphatase
VEGVTEYLPVSSTGHLLLAQRIMGIGGRTDAESPEARNRKEASDAYAICIQGGAIMAVLFLYARRVRGMALGVLGRDPAGRRLTVSVGLAFLPAAIVGLLLEGRIKSHLFGPWPVVGAWFAGGAVILWVASQMRRRPSRAGSALEAMAWPGAVLIGLIQCVAMWPGVSRSLATILGGLAAGLSLPAAVEFSFLLGVVTLGAATASDALRHGQAMLAAFDWTSMAVGFAAAFVSAVLAVRWMVGYLSRHGLGIFGYYRLAAALVTAALLLSGRL